MVQLTPKSIHQIGLIPGPDGPWVCCTADKGFTHFDAEVTISATFQGRNELGFPEYDWRIVEIRASRLMPGFRHKDEYALMTGASFKDCRDWLMEHERDRLDTHVACDYSPSSDGAMADYRRAEAVL